MIRYEACKQCICFPFEAQAVYIYVQTHVLLVQQTITILHGFIRAGTHLLTATSLTANDLPDLRPCTSASAESSRPSSLQRSTDGMNTWHRISVCGGERKYFSSDERGLDIPS
jgi:hypothetical protein